MLELVWDGGLAVAMMEALCIVRDSFLAEDRRREASGSLFSQTRIFSPRAVGEDGRSLGLPRNASLAAA